MIVPRYWAEARARTKSAERQITVRRFGFSDESQEAAQRHAEARAQEALERLVSGETLSRREKKRAYAGGDGLPIREEIVATVGDVVITRNGYGARCLNVSDVLFVDVDFETAVSPKAVGVAALACGLTGIVCGLLTTSWSQALGFGLVGLVMSPLVTELGLRARTRLLGGVEGIALRRAREFSQTHPLWHLRVYRTRGGLRVLVMHRTFDPLEAETSECFAALGADPTYVRMCRAQRCFRARLTPKPWRIGMPSLGSLTRAIWPVPQSLVSPRAEWVARYEAASRDYAACAFVESLGTISTDARAEQVRSLHDEACRAGEPKPLA